MRTPRGPIPPRGRTVDRYAPGGPGAERLAGIERAPVRAAASARLVQSQAATVAPAAVRGEAAVPVSAPVRAAAATCPSPRGTARRSVCAAFRWLLQCLVKLS